MHFSLPLFFFPFIFLVIVSIQYVYGSHSLLLKKDFLHVTGEMGATNDDNTLQFHDSQTKKKALSPLFCKI